MRHRPLIIGLVGLAGTGKSTAARMILKDHSFELMRLGDGIRDALKAKGWAQTPENERRVQLSIREQHGMAALVKLSAPEIRSSLSKGSSVLIDSMCSFSERECLQEIAGDVVVYIVAVHAPLERRLLQLRTRHERPLSPVQMEQRDLLELDHLEKGKLLALADHHLLNDGALEALEHDVGLLMQLVVATKRTEQG